MSTEPKDRVYFEGETLEVDVDEMVAAFKANGHRVEVYEPTEADRIAATESLAAKDQALTDLSGTLPPALMEFNPQSRQRGNAWDERDDKLWLLTPAEYEMVPEGTVLVCISGQTGVKGVDYIDQDTRAGYIAWGVLDSQLPKVR